MFMTIRDTFDVKLPKKRAANVFLKL